MGLFEIYRIGYEAIRDAYTHWNGNRLEVSLRYGKDLAVCVSDNGVGIDPTVADQEKTVTSVFRECASELLASGANS